MPYSQPEDLLDIFEFTSLKIVAGYPDADDLDDEDLRARLVKQAKLAAVEIDIALAHRYSGIPNTPAPFIPQNTLSGSLTLTQWSDEATGDEESDLATEIAEFEGVSDADGHWAQVKTVDIDETTGEVTLRFEAPWSAADYEGACVRGIVHPAIRHISKYLTLDSLFERDPNKRGKMTVADAILRARTDLQSIKDGKITLAGIASVPQVRSDSVDADGVPYPFETDLLYGTSYPFNRGQE